VRSSSIAIAPSAETIIAVMTGETLVTSPSATPVSAMWPIPSPSRASLRWTMKVPTAGADTPMRNAARSARCMKS
jgi:hypothetical protein